MIELIFFAIIVSIIAALWCYAKIKRKFNNAASKIKGLPAYPIVGSMLYFAGPSNQILNKIIQLQNFYGTEPFKFWVGPFLNVMVCKQEDAQVLLNSSKSLQKSWFYKFLSKSFGNGLLTAPVTKWKKHRRMISPAFNSRSLIQFFPVFNEKNHILVRNLMKEVDKPSSFDLWDYVSSATIDSICQTTMNYDTTLDDPNGKSEFGEAALKIHELALMRIANIWLHPDFVYSIYGYFTGVHKFYESLYKLPLQIIKQGKLKFAQKKQEKNVIDINDEEKKLIKTFLDILLECNEADSKNFSDQNIKDEVLTMMMAGSDPTAITSCFCLLMLALYPDIQDKVYDEIYKLIGNNDNPISFEDVKKLEYLEQVLMETLRLFPIIPLIFRKLEKDIKIVSGDNVLPKGTMVSINIFGMHRSPEYYPNPLNFDPENFSKDNNAKRHKYGFIPFSGGPRGCIGIRYAMLSMKHLVATFLRKFSVHTEIKISDIKLKLDIVLRSLNGYPVTIRTRKKNEIIIKSEE